MHRRVFTSPSTFGDVLRNPHLAVGPFAFETDAVVAGWRQIRVWPLSSWVVGGVRKIRVKLGSRGNRGFARVIPKSVSADLTPRQVAQLAKVVKEESSKKP